MEIILARLSPHIGVHYNPDGRSYQRFATSHTHSEYVFNTDTVSSVMGQTSLFVSTNVGGRIYLYRCKRWKDTNPAFKSATEMPVSFYTSNFTPI